MSVNQDDEFGDADCTCFKEESKYQYEYIDKSNSTCTAKRHFGDIFLSRLGDNIRDLKRGHSIVDEAYHRNQKMIRLIEAILNGGGNDFPATVPFDIFYVFQDLIVEILPDQKIDERVFYSIVDEEHTCLASKLVATFILMIIHGLLTKEKTNALSSIPTSSIWMQSILCLILEIGKEVDAPIHDKDYFPGWRSVLVSDPLTGCNFLCHVILTSRAFLNASWYLIKIIPLNISISTALNVLKTGKYCNCRYKKPLKDRAITVDILYENLLCFDIYREFHSRKYKALELEASEYLRSQGNKSVAVRSDVPTLFEPRNYSSDT